jgi:iron-regulated transporter 1
MSDLSVTQLLLEVPEDSVRGAVSGVQSSLNQLEDLIKSLLVIVLPWQQTFGFLVLLSFVSIFIANILFACFSRRAGKFVDK